MSDEVLNPRVPNLRRPEKENQTNCIDLEGFILSRSVLNNERPLSSTQRGIPSPWFSHQTRLLLLHVPTSLSWKNTDVMDRDCWYQRHRTRPIFWPLLDASFWTRSLNCSEPLSSYLKSGYNPISQVHKNKMRQLQ